MEEMKMFRPLRLSGSFPHLEGASEQQEHQFRSLLGSLEAQSLLMLVGLHNIDISNRAINEYAEQLKYESKIRHDLVTRESDNIKLLDYAKLEVVAGRSRRDISFLGPGLHIAFDQAGRLIFEIALEQFKKTIQEMQVYPGVPEEARVIADRFRSTPVTADAKSLEMALEHVESFLAQLPYRDAPRFD